MQQHLTKVASCQRAPLVCSCILASKFISPRHLHWLLSYRRFWQICHFRQIRRLAKGSLLSYLHSLPRCRRFWQLAIFVTFVKFAGLPRGPSSLLICIDSLPSWPRCWQICHFCHIRHISQTCHFRHIRQIRQIRRLSEGPLFSSHLHSLPRCRRRQTCHFRHIRQIHQICRLAKGPLLFSHQHWLASCRRFWQNCHFCHIRRILAPLPNQTQHD